MPAGPVGQHRRQRLEGPRYLCLPRWPTVPALLAYQLPPGGGNDAHHPTVFCYTNIGPRSGPAREGNEREGERSDLICDRETLVSSRLLTGPATLHHTDNSTSTSSTFSFYLRPYASSFRCLFFLSTSFPLSQPPLPLAFSQLFSVDSLSATRSTRYGKPAVHSESLSLSVAY